MADLFQRQHPITKFLTGLTNLMMVNFLFIITSLPIFTIGASLTAMHKVIFKTILNEDPSVIREYFTTFKKEFKQATILWIPVLLLILFFFYEIYIVNMVLDKSLFWMQFPIWAFLFCTVSVLFYGFPMLANFENTNKEIIKNSILLSLSHIPTTIMFIVVTLIVPLIVDAFPGTIGVFFLLLCFFGFAIIGWYFDFYLRRIFKLEKKPDNIYDTDK